jgi:protein-disulfide isomerase
VAVIKFSDFECPYCATVARDTLPQLEQAYVSAGNVLMAFRHLPIATIHPFATAAAEAAVCASEQGKFWQLHDLFFAAPKKLDEAVVQQAIATLAIDADAFRTCRSVLGPAQVRRDMSAAMALGIRSTPTLLVGRLQSDRTVQVTARFSGAVSFDRLRREVDRLLVPSGL